MRDGTLPIVPFHVFVLNPAGCDDPALAIAGSRTGGVGVVNFEMGGLRRLDSNLERMCVHARSPFGVKIANVDIATLEGILRHRDGGLAYLILDALSEESHHAALAGFRAGGGRVMVEITEWEPSLGEREARLDGLWIKGHEAGGWVGEQTSFILLQAIAGRTALPVFVRGGINIHSAAACKVGGAAGVVLDDQLLLLRDCPLREALAPKLRFFTGQETILLDGRETNRHLRIWSVPGRNDARELQKQALQGARPLSDLAAGLGWGGEGSHLVPPLGQDAAMAVAWGERFGSVAAVLRAIDDEVASRPQRALTVNVLGADSPLARSHGTRLPIVQGPMTRVSDSVPFVEAIAASGALPMVAVSLMKGEAVTELLAETSRRLGEKAWGVGLLGFVPPEILNDQRRAVRESRPPFAIIAGGRPDQAQELEAVGIKTYLHVPSPVLLEQFLEQGGRRFIFEGRECGGHIGPLSSFVLWGRMVDTLLGHPLLRDGAEYPPCAVCRRHPRRDDHRRWRRLIALPLAEKGVRVGILMGTAYVFTAEAVSSPIDHAEVPAGSGRLRRRRSTWRPGPGTPAAAPSPRSPSTSSTDGRRLRKPASPPTRSATNSKSCSSAGCASRRRAERAPDAKAAANSPRFARGAGAGGMFMIGQVGDDDRRPTRSPRFIAWSATMRSRCWPKQSPAPRCEAPCCARPPTSPSSASAACFPEAHDDAQYWQNILDKVDAITEVPPHRWDWRLYFDSDRTARDKIYSKWGGFLDDIAFDPMRFGMPPKSIIVGRPDAADGA